jgi:hypothetical protein
MDLPCHTPRWAAPSAVPMRWPPPPSPPTPPRRWPACARAQGAGLKFLKLKHLGELEFKRSGAAAQANASAPQNRIGIRRLPLRRLDDDKSAGEGAADGRPVAPRPVAAGTGLNGGAASASAPPGADALPLGVGSTIRIPGLDDDADAAPTGLPLPAPAPASAAGMALGDGSAASAMPRKSLKDIMREYAKPTLAPSASAPAAPAGGGAGAAAAAGKGGGAGKAGPDKKSGGGGGGGGGAQLTGLAALRARFEKK